MSPLRIATWNVNGLRARLDFVLAWLKARQPDVVGLQELKLSDDKLPGEAFEALGYQVASHGQKAWNGVAILSREQARVTQRGLPGQEESGARLISADVAGIEFTTIYCPNGKHLGHDDYPKKLAWFDSLVAHLGEATQPDRARVLCGDFNVCPTELDTWDEAGMAGEIFHTEAERARIRALFELGFVDLFRARHPDERSYSWWDYRDGAFHRGHGLRIDFVLGSRAVVERLESVTIDREWRKKQDGLTASDHCPVYADLR